MAVHQCWDNGSGILAESWCERLGHLSFLFPQAQSDLEVQVNSVSQLLNKLQEADRQLQKLTEQQIKIQSQPSERLYHQERVSELERQLAQLTEQRLQHLEKLQQQQLEMQVCTLRIK